VRGDRAARNGRRNVGDGCDARELYVSGPNDSGYYAEDAPATAVSNALVDGRIGARPDRMYPQIRKVRWNVKVLRSCLAGVATDDDYFRKGVDACFSWVDSKSDDDYSTAVDNFRTGRGALDAVAADCNKAGELIQ